MQANPDLNAITPHKTRWRWRGAALRGGSSRATCRSTIDGTEGAVQGIIDGWISGVIESNPRFGPLAFQALEDFYSGTGVPEVTIISDKEYTQDNAEEELVNAY